MNARILIALIAVLIAGSPGMSARSQPQTAEPVQRLSRDIFRQLIEINTTDSSASTTAAAQSMAKRLLDAGFPAADVIVIGPNERKGNLVARLNAVTREYFNELAATETGQRAADFRAILRPVPDPAAIARLSLDARYNATMRTTCVPTMMSAGHAANALPQNAVANVNCRIFPGHSQEEK